MGIFDQLLRDGRCAFFKGMGLQIVQQRAAYPFKIKAVVGKKALILNGNKGILEVLGYFA